MKNFWAGVKFWSVRVLVAAGPFLLGVLGGVAGAIYDALKAYTDGGNALTWGSLWTIGGSAALTYLVAFVFKSDKEAWLKAILQFANVIFTPREALQAAAEQVKPLTPVEKIGEKVLPPTDQKGE